MDKIVLCIKWGTFYGPEYVNRLYAMTARNITPPFQFVCMTDNRAGLNKDIQCFDLPELGCEHPVDVPGKWAKVALWNKDLFSLSGTALFVDLDTVIVDQIDDFFHYKNPDDVILARNWLKPAYRLGQTTLFRFPIGKHSYLLEEFRKDPQAIAEKYRFEQHYVTQGIRGGVQFWPARWVRHYRHHCLGRNYLNRYRKPARLPRGARIIAFPGFPNPADAVQGSWAGRPAANSAWKHFCNGFTEKRVTKSFIRHMKSYHLPCEWVKEHWAE
jgi:hypothetical protein